jgi:hypothetical protein
MMEDPDRKQQGPPSTTGFGQIVTSREVGAVRCRGSDTAIANLHDLVFVWFDVRMGTALFE